MTGDHLPSTLSGKLIEFSKLLGALSIIFSCITGLWLFTWGAGREFLDTFYEMQLDIAELKADMRAEQGEDRVIRETPGLTYVSEPVYQGENITFNFHAARTTLGAGCQFRSSQPIFTDVINAPTPGQIALGNIQLTIIPSVARPEYAVPPSIRPGRVSVYLVLEYTCDGTLVRDQTSVAAFELMSGARPTGENR